MTPGGGLTPGGGTITGLTDPATQDWDGVTILVAPAKSIQTFNAMTGVFSSGTLAQDTGFENIPAGADLTVDAAPVAVTRTFVTGGWRWDEISGLNLPGIRIVSAGTLAGSVAGDQNNMFPGATSGNSLCIAADNSSSGTTMFGRLQSFNITPIQPGEIYGVSMNVSTDIPGNDVANFAQNVKLKISANTQPDFGQFTACARVSAAAGFADAANVVPTDGVWQQLFTEFRVPALNFSADQGTVGGSGDINLADRGMRVAITLLVSANTPAFNVYIDNVYIYCKGLSDLNYFDSNGDDANSTGVIEKGLAHGVTAFTAYNAQNPGTNGTLISTDFEGVADLGDANWVADSSLGFFSNPSTPDAGIETQGRGGSGGSLRMALAGTSSNAGEIYGVRVRTRAIGIAGTDTQGAAIAAGLPDISGEGHYGVSFWVSTNSASIANNPQVKFSLQERRPTLNQVINSLLIRPSALPTVNDGWHQFSMTGPYPQELSGPAMTQALLVIDQWSLNDFRSATEQGSFSGTNRPGYNSNGTVFIDDINVHRVRDNSAYFDYSIFD
jgi:hypothetical protein